MNLLCSLRILRSATALLALIMYTHHSSSSDYRFIRFGRTGQHAYPVSLSNSITYLISELFFTEMASPITWRA